MKLLNYEPSNISLWQGRADNLPGECFFQQVQIQDLRQQALAINQAATILIGFCSDEGIRRNGGRIGAKSGPMALREQLAKLASGRKRQLIDVGNIISAEDLESAQEEFSTLISYCHQQGYKTLALGGGHEIAWAHFRGLSGHYPKLGIINFDAHFDLRPLKEGLYATSGSPFRQIADFCSENQRPFDYCCLGIQPNGNTESLFETAKALKVSYLNMEQINQKSLRWQKDFLKAFMQRHDQLYLSLCLDVFAESFAPGVSAPQALGLTPWQALPLLKYILQSGKVVSLDIAELSPPLDEGQKTARLAASLLATMLDHF
jgi:formiminoglutamase